MEKIEYTTLETKNGYALQSYKHQVSMNRGEMKTALSFRVVRLSKPLAVIDDYLSIGDAKVLFDKHASPEEQPTG